MRMRFLGGALLVCLSVLVCTLGAVSAAPAPVSVATISIQKILGNSKIAQEAQKTLQVEVDKLQTKFKADEDSLAALKADIEKKSSVWSEEVRAGKEREYQKKLRDFGLKTEDAKLELQQLEKKVMDPILKELHDLIAEIGKKNGYTLILENTMKGLRNRTGLLYADESLDISDLIQKELDLRLKK